MEDKILYVFYKGLDSDMDGKLCKAMGQKNWASGMNSDGWRDLAFSFNSEEEQKRASIRFMRFSKSYPEVTFRVERH